MRLTIRTPQPDCFLLYRIGYPSCQRAAQLRGILRRENTIYTYWRRAARARRSFKINWAVGWGPLYMRSTGCPSSFKNYWRVAVAVAVCVSMLTWATYGMTIQELQIQIQIQAAALAVRRGRLAVNVCIWVCGSDLTTATTSSETSGHVWPNVLKSAPTASPATSPTTRVGRNRSFSCDSTMLFKLTVTETFNTAIVNS